MVWGVQGEEASTMRKSCVSLWITNIFPFFVSNTVLTMPRKHVQSAKTNNPSRPGVLHVTYNRSTTFLWQASSQGLNDGTMWSTCPEHQQGIKYRVKFSMYFNFTPTLEAVYYRIRLQTKHSLAERSDSQVGVLIYSIPPTWRAHSSVRHAQWHVSASNLPKAHMSAKTRGRESDRPQLSVWRLPVWDKKDSLSGAGGSQRWHDTGLHATVSAASFFFF